MYAAGIRQGTLAPTYAGVGEIKQVRWCTLNTLEISFKRVTNTLLYVGIRCYAANRSQILYLHKFFSVCRRIAKTLGIS